MGSGVVYGDGVSGAIVYGMGEGREILVGDEKAALVKAVAALTLIALHSSDGEARALATRTLGEIDQDTTLRRLNETGL